MKWLMGEEYKDELGAKFGLYHAFVDDKLILHLENNMLCEYLAYPEYSEQIHVNKLFPELADIGVNEKIPKIINGELPGFALRAMSRDDNDSLLFDLYFYRYNYKNFKCVLTVKDIGEEMNCSRIAQQSRNEIIFLQDKLVELNSRLVSVNVDTETLNRELENKVKARTEELEKNIKHTKDLFLQTIDALTQTLEIKDLYTAGHQYRVSALATAIAKKMNLSESVIEGIQIAGKLHDIGKIYVPTEFLTKPGCLREEEFEVIKVHTVMGFEIMKNIEFPWPIASIILQHHENLDGSGYPFSLEGDAILLEARIVAVADVVEAMSTNRPYRISPGIENALEEIENFKGIKYDSDATEACLELFRSGEFQWPETHEKSYKGRKAF